MNVRDIAQQRGFSMVEIAEKLGISKYTLSQNVNGNPTINTLRKIADVIGCNVTEFFADEVSSPSEVKDASHGLVCPHCGKPIDVSLTKHE